MYTVAAVSCYSSIPGSNGPLSPPANVSSVGLLDVDTEIDIVEVCTTAIQYGRGGGRERREKL